MRPVKIIMEAFGSYSERTEVDFRLSKQNFFLITGDTGSGKTTIFDAIVFALYGEASSLGTKKAGEELQSQYTEREPFVELIFSLGQDTYCVRRSPRHVRRKLRGAGSVAVAETVSLILPEGTEYPPKETNKKIEELVGLTKEQFLQVGMLSQGEFMELLRAKSDKKREIYRKLFGTGLYQEVVEELAKHKRALQSSVEKLQAVLSSLISSFKILEESEESTLLQSLSLKLTSERELSITALEEYVVEAQQYNTLLAHQEQAAEAEALTSQEELNKSIEALNTGKVLANNFVKLELAKQRLNKLEQNAFITQEKRLLAENINKAYSILPLWERYEDSAKELAATEQEITDLTVALPQLEADLVAMASRTKEALASYQSEQKSQTQIEQQVEGARKLFAQIAQATDELNKVQLELQQVDTKRAALEAEAQERSARSEELAQEVAHLQEVPVLIEQNKALLTESKALRQELSTHLAAQQEAAQQQKTTQELMHSYSALREECEQKATIYRKLLQAYWDNQAGFLAKEYLQPNAPCPVCGSCVHPAPAIIHAAYADLSKEKVERSEQVAKVAQEKMQSLAGELQAAQGILKEKIKQVEEKYHTFEKHWEHIYNAKPSALDAQQIALDLAAQQQELTKRGRSLSLDAKKLKVATQELTELKPLITTLNASVAQLKQQESSLKVWQSELSGKLSTLVAQKTFASLEIAETELTRAQKQLSKASKIAQACERAQRSAQEKYTQAQTNLTKAQQARPHLAAKVEASQKQYRQELAQAGMEEERFKASVTHYKKRDAEKILREIEQYEQELAKEKWGIQKTESELTGKQKPDLDVLSRGKDEASKSHHEAQQAYQRLKAVRTDDESIVTKICGQLRERQEVANAYARIDSLYRRLSGNESGARLDIETYVQRYYLSRILKAANVRFAKMSAGQYELRLTKLERAGEGKNRGLDLMVYSTVTGKEREIRTLSGGESFMAALSLALGMADQITASSAAISLDMLFIDEGFGTLDDHARTQAVRVLKDMVGGERLTGIISHVTELKQEIDEQLIVTKDERGSHVRWVEG